MPHLKQRLNKGLGQRVVLGAALLLVCLLLSAHAQRGRRFGRYGGYVDSATMQEQEKMKKAIDPAFQEDVFTFARLHFEPESGYGYGRGRSWDDDSPLADLNVVYRLFEVTSMKVRPGMNVIDITTDQLAEQPFVYAAAGGRFAISDDEAAALRRYLLNGGFMMVDDFWGDEQWDHFSEELKKIFPERPPELMDLTHPIFHTVFNFKKQPQIPSVGDYESTGLSYEETWPYDRMNHDPHYFGVYDDKHRLMMLICHNNHYGDGWEHEGHDESYFDLFSEPMGYPMLINILAYTMSH